MARLEGFVLSSHSVRCRDADSLVFDSVRLFESSKHATGMFPLTASTVLNVLPIQTWHAWRDSNPQPSDS